MHHSPALRRSLVTGLAVFLGCVVGCGETQPPQVTAASESKADERSTPVRRSSTVRQAAPETENADSTKPSAEPTAVGSAAAHPQWQAGRDALGREEWQAAADAFTLCIVAHPADPMPYLFRADAYRHLESDADARADYAEAIRVAPEFATVYESSGIDHMRAGRPGLALRDFQAALRLDPNLPSARNNLGLIFLGQGRLADSVEQFTRAVASDETMTDALSNRGLAYLQLQQFTEAQADFDAVLERHPQHLSARKNRAALFLQTNRHADAVADLSVLIENRPSDVTHYRLRRQALKALGREAEAEADRREIDWLLRFAHIEESLRKQPDAPKWLVLRGLLHAAKGRRQDALADYAHALRLNPRCGSAYVARATLRFESGEIQQALSDCEAALAISPRQDAYRLRGEIRLTQKREAEAITDFERAGRLDEQVAVAYERHARSLAANGDVNAAEAALNRAASIRGLLSGGVTPTSLKQTAERTFPAEPFPVPAD